MPIFKRIIFFISFTLSATQYSYAQSADADVSHFFQSLNESPNIAAGGIASAQKNIQPTRNVTPMLMYAKNNWDKLSPSTKALLNPWFMRPTDTGASSGVSGVGVFTAAQEATPITTTHFKFHYLDAATNPTDPNRATLAFVQQLATIAEAVWASEINTMGYNSPPSDGVLGGDSLYDVYLLNVGSKGVYGYVTSDATSFLGTPYPHSLFTHMVVDNDFAEFPQGATNAAKVTIAHEFFHSIQNGYDRSEYPAFLESLSTWMEDKVYPAIKDNLQYIGEVYTDSNGDGQYSSGEAFTDRNGNGRRESGSQDYPELHLDSFGLSGNGLEQYGRFMWIRYLSDKHGNALINKILTAMGQTAGNNTYTAINTSLQNFGSSLAAAFHEFGIWNIDTSKYSPRNGVPAEQEYPIAWGDQLFNNGAINISSDATQSLKSSFFAGKQKHLSTIYELVNNPSGTYTFTTSGSARVTAMTQSIVGGAFTNQVIPLSGGQGSWSAPANLAKVTFVISNVSPTDDAMTWRLSDGVTAPLPSIANTSGTTGGGTTTGGTTTTSSSSSGGCLSDAFSPWQLLALLGFIFLAQPNKRRKTANIVK